MSCLSCHACHVTSCHVMSCHVMPIMSKLGYQLSGLNHKNSVLVSAVTKRPCLVLTLNGVICALKKDYRTGALLCLHIKVANGLKMWPFVTGKLRFLTATCRFAFFSPFHSGNVLGEFCVQKLKYKSDVFLNRLTSKIEGLMLEGLTLITSKIDQHRKWIYHKK